MSSETSPLLGSTEQSSPESPTPCHTTNGNVADHQATKYAPIRSRLYPSVVILAFLFSIVADLGGSMVNSPDVRLLELTICRDYYRNHDPTVIGPPPWSYVPEDLCKLKEIQRELASLRAAKSTLMTIPGLILTYFYGRLADKIGRKPVLLLGLTGQVLSYLWILLVCFFYQLFPTRAVLVAPAFLVIGGGVRVLTAIINSAVVDVTPVHMRTTIFYLLGAGSLLTNITATPLGAWLLSKDVWLPYAISTPVILLSYPILIVMPETLPKEREPPPDSAAQSDDRSSRSASIRSKPLQARLLQRLQENLRQTASALTVSRQLTICVVIIFLNAFSGSSTILFIQFVSKLLGWSISSSGYLLSINSAVSLTGLILMALITRTVTTKTSVASLRWDIWVARMCLVLLTIGNLTLGLSQRPATIISGAILSSSGNGIIQAMQGIIAASTNAASMGQLYAGVAQIELLAGLIGNIAFAGLFNLGLSLDSSIWLGLPYLVSAALFLLTLGIAVFIPMEFHVPHEQHSQH